MRAIFKSVIQAQTLGEAISYIPADWQTKIEGADGASQPATALIAPPDHTAAIARLNSGEVFSASTRLAALKAAASWAYETCPTPLDNDDVPAPPRISLHIDLSTGHLTEEVSNQIDNIGTNTPAWRDRLSIMPREYGWFVRVPDLTNMSRETYDEFPPCLRDCFDQATKIGANWILFDRDEEVVDSLPVYEW